MTNLDPELVRKANALGIRPDQLRDSAWIQPVKHGRGRWEKYYTHVLVVTYSDGLVRVKLPHPAATLFLCCSLLEHYFHLPLLTVDTDDSLEIIYVNREATLKKFDLDPSDRFSFDRVAFWMQEQTANL